MIRLLEFWKTATTRRTSIRTSTWMPNRWKRRPAKMTPVGVGKAARCGGLFVEIQEFSLRKGRKLTRIAKLFVFVLMAGLSRHAQASPPQKLQAAPHRCCASSRESVAHIATPGAGSTAHLSIGNGRWRSLGFQVLWRIPIGEASYLVLHAGVFSGQFEFGGNIMPLWQAYTPPRTMRNILYCERYAHACTLPVAGGTYRGVSLTPVIFRWNFLTKSRRVQPWFRARRLIYTPASFRQAIRVLRISPSMVRRACGIFRRRRRGHSLLHRDRRSIDLAVNAVHISSASLGDRNPASMPASRCRWAIPSGSDGEKVDTLTGAAGRSGFNADRIQGCALSKPG